MSEPSGPDKRQHERKPIRLKVVYKSARSLVTEYTTSVSKGGCQLESERPLPVGTEFTFEMYAKGATEPVEITGQVVRCDPVPNTQWVRLAIKYVSAGPRQKAIEQLLEHIFHEHQFERARQHPRVPVNLVATDVADPTMRYLIRDISIGGMGLRLPVDRMLRPEVQPGMDVRLTITGPETVDVAGEVVWTIQGRLGYTPARVGIRFAKLSDSHRALVDSMVHLHRPPSLSVAFLMRAPKGPARKPA